MEVYGLRADYDAGAVAITSATSYFDYDLQSNLDLSPIGLVGLRQRIRFQSKVFAEELTFASTGKGVWRWSAGASYRDDTDRLTQAFGGPLSTDYEDSSQSWAVFGELTRVFLDGQLELTGGLRYFDDSQGLDAAVPLVLHAQTSFDALTPRAVVTWHPNQDLTFYASYAVGFRSGLLQQPNVLAVAPQFQPADPDYLHNYELGTKAILWDGRLRLEAAVFYLDWKDLQQTLSVQPGANNPALTAVLNANSASGLGYELAATLAPTDRFTITGSVSWNDLAFDSDVFSGGRLLFAEGDRLQNSPEYTAGLSLDYDFTVGNGFDLLTSLSGNYISAIEYNNRDAAGNKIPGTDGDSILNSRASVTLSAPENWALTLFVDNIGNEHGPTTRGVFPPTWWSLNTRPRTYGLQMEFRM
jgi:outer membrane receptor protein involved in Fe transport